MEALSKRNFLICTKLLIILILVCIAVSLFSTALSIETPCSVKIPYLFTEQGVYMLATVLKSGIAVEVTKQIMRTFTKLKNQSVPYFDIIKRLEKLETNDKETTELLQKVVQVVSSMQSIHDEAREGTKKIEFV